MDREHLGTILEAYKNMSMKKESDVNRRNAEKLSRLIFENPARLSSKCRWYGCLQDGRSLPCPHWEERRQKW